MENNLPQKKLHDTPGYKIVSAWFASNNMSPFAFQEEAWQHIINNQSGLVNAPTGCGKTFSVFLGAVINFINNNVDGYSKKKKNGLQLLWVTPLRALAKDIARAMEEVIAGLGMQWQIGSRNGDTPIAERQKQRRQMPEVLIITPESMHLLLAQKDYAEIFTSLKTIAVDEWHELLGSKRGVQVELAISRILGVTQATGMLSSRTERRSRECEGSAEQRIVNLWGISATIGNLEQARDVLLSPLKTHNSVIVRANIPKPIEVISVFPDEIEKYPWSGHLGIKLVHKAIEIINNSRTTLIFINTRGMSELWYQTLLKECPDLAGAIALHHGSIDMEMRTWVEESLHTGILKAVVCTASLDLGVDFRPVETVIQVGSPKGVARFLQRAGRSGHQPGEVSRIYFLPTHSLELVEAAALKAAKDINFIESRDPRILCFDVLVQYLCTLAVSDGFRPEEIFEEVRTTYCYRDITDDEFSQITHFITSGGTALQQYDEYKKVEVIDGLYKINSRRLAMRHRLHIGTIVSDPMLKVRFIGGGYIGMIEEWFISRLQPGDVFTLAGRTLEFVMIKEMTVLARKSSSKKSNIPSWQGGRMPLSANLGIMLRKKFNEAYLVTNDKKAQTDVEVKALEPLFILQQSLSHIPKEDELLIEHIETKDGYHLFVYPFEGRLVHEALGALLSYRLSRITPITFSFAMNDYGFELLSDRPIPLDDSNADELFSAENLLEDIQRSVNSAEMAKRKFRDIAVIGGLIFQGYPGEYKKARHLQSSASLLFQVFNEYDKNNLLLRQAYNEVMEQQMEEARLRDTLSRINNSKIVITFPKRLTPFSFPLKVDSMRENLSSEKLEDRVKRMQEQLSK
ncbi:MAG: ligase-associated DNA damage response DEXH box helicase [Chitinophagaceae bacterium]|nr:ligase-associated DNA damage response DEXH box helicase [Chitinophagaceae bacterium]